MADFPCGPRLLCCNSLVHLFCGVPFAFLNPAGPHIVSSVAESCYSAGFAWSLLPSCSSKFCIFPSLFLWPFYGPAPFVGSGLGICGVLHLFFFVPRISIQSVLAFGLHFICYCRCWLHILLLFFGPFLFDRSLSDGKDPKLGWCILLMDEPMLFMRFALLW